MASHDGAAPPEARVANRPKMLDRASIVNGKC